MLDFAAFLRDHDLIENPQPQPSAGLIRRLIALVYDGFLMFAIILAYAGLVLAIRVLISDAEAAIRPFTGFAAAVFLFGMWLGPALFYCICWRRSGQTLGMKTWRLKLITSDRQIPSWSQCLLRCICAHVSLLILGLGYFWCLFGDKNCWHDLWSDTRIVVLPKPEK